MSVRQMAHISEGASKSYRDDIGPGYESLYGVRMRSTHTTILTDVKKGDPVAQGRFFRRYADPICCYFMAKGFDRDTAKELLSRVTVKLVRRSDRTDQNMLLGEYDREQGSFRRFLFRILDNEAKSFWRDQNTKQGQWDRQVGRLDISPTGHAQEPIADDLTPETEFDRRRARIILSDAFQAVRDREAAMQGKDQGVPSNLDMLLAYYFDNKRWVQIANECGLSDNAVKGRAAAAAGWLRDAIISLLCDEGMSGAEIEEEVRQLLASLASGRRE
jgi:DNA-directed RNA polymerase specialized sigma24 family protein